MKLKEKLSSRKFWAAIVGVVSALCAAFGCDSITTEQIIAVITAAGVLIAYILAEAYVDTEKKPTDITPAEKKENEK